MLDKKTTEEIFNLYPKICYAGIEHEEVSFKDKNKCIKLKNKVWISQESIIRLLEKERYTPFKGTEASDDISSQIIEDIWKELKGEK